MTDVRPALTTLQNLAAVLAAANVGVPVIIGAVASVVALLRVGGPYSHLTTDQVIDTLGEVLRINAAFGREEIARLRAKLDAGTVGPGVVGTDS